MKVWVRGKFHLQEGSPGLPDQETLDGFDVREYPFEGASEVSLRKNPDKTSLEFYIYASDFDDAIERAGHAADEEYYSTAKAMAAYDPECHEGKKLFKVSVEEANL